MPQLKCFAVFAFIFLLAHSLGAQVKSEREFRIRKSQFPKNALQLIENKLEAAQHIRFYKEIDSNKISFEAKFKKDKLRYSVEFDQEGVLEDVEILIKEVDVPEESYAQIKDYLEKNFAKYRILRMQQQYPVGKNSSEKTIENAFQNLMLATIKYELVVGGKKNNSYEKYEILFDAEGAFEKIRIAIPPNYDHILY